MNSPTLFAIIALAALVHASFQLSISMLTLVSGHALGKKSRHTRVLNLMSSFVLGAMAMTALLVCTIALFAYLGFGTSVHPQAWAIACGLMAGTAVAIWVFYYRHRQTGTVLWLPRSQVNALHGRIHSTKSGVEAFSLGLAGVMMEIVFTAAPLLVAAFALASLPRSLQIVGIITYTLITCLPLLIVTVLVGGGHSVSSVQKWREQNRNFIQLSAGAALFVLAAYVYVNTVLAPMWLQGTL